MMNTKRKRILQASQAEILRSHQRDSQFVRLLNDQFQEILINYKIKKSIGIISSETVMKFLYFYLTHGLGNQTLGEEYTGIVPVKLKTLSIQPLSRLIFVTLTECFGQTCVEKLIDSILRWLKCPRCTLTPEAIDYFNNLFQRLQTVIPTLIIFHQGIFYLTGRYPSIGKRFFGIDYAKVYGKRATQSINWGIKCLGLIMLAQCALRVWRLELVRSSPDNEKQMAIQQNTNTMKCNLCLERKPTTTSVCGHLFCWFCIVEWLQGQHHCPLCREPISPSRIVHLMNL